MNSRLEAQLKTLPARPGVYVFRDEGGAVLYIGKAKSLRSRVRSYFQKGAAATGWERPSSSSGSRTSRRS